MSYNKAQMQIKYSCEKCRFSTKDEEKYKNHVSLHNDIKFVCSHCTYVSYTKGDFQRHLVTHTGKYPFSCEYCGYGAIRNDYIIKHKQRIHGNGMIQCSVSIDDNDVKNASVNIVQTQLHNSLKVYSRKRPTESLKPSLKSETVSDMGNYTFLNRTFGSGQDCQMEVEVISPISQLLPGMPLTVLAPLSFEVPFNCYAQIAEVRHVNNTFQLHLKLFKQIDLSLQNGDTRNLKYEEQKQPNTVSQTTFQPRKSGGNLNSCLLQAENTMVADCHRNPLNSIQMENEVHHTAFSKTELPIHENIESFLESVSQQSTESINHVLEGPFISSVFSLSCGSNSLEGISWSSGSSTNTDIVLPRETVDLLDFPQLSIHPAENQLITNEPICNVSEMNENEHIRQPLLLNGIIDTNKSIDYFEEKEVKQSFDKSQLPFSKQVLSYNGKCEAPNPVLFHNPNKRQRKSSIKFKTETDFCSKPHTLFLSCDKTVVMQPVSCATQNQKNVPVLLERNELIVQSKTQEHVRTYSEHNKFYKNSEKSHKSLKQYKTQTLEHDIQSHKRLSQIKSKEKFKEKKVSKQKVKAPAKSQRTSPAKKIQQIPKSLRLLPAKEDQLVHIPDYNQPVVVLNHPDVESLEIFHIMKAINKFKGNLIKVTLRKRFV